MRLETSGVAVKEEWMGSRRLADRGSWPAKGIDRPGLERTIGIHTFSRSCQNDSSSASRASHSWTSWPVAKSVMIGSPAAIAVPGQGTSAMAGTANGSRHARIVELDLRGPPGLAGVENRLADDRGSAW